MAVVDTPFFPAMIPPTVAGPLPGSRHRQDKGSQHHRIVLRDDGRWRCCAGRPGGPGSFPALSREPAEEQRRRAAGLTHPRFAVACRRSCHVRGG